ncbi:MAG: ABC transporter ATP-binding protein [Proteobacteria bacterium]|nr:ABC transporter ATP-binding protein [Pseudomonadota bacterium]
MIDLAPERARSATPAAPAATATAGEALLELHELSQSFGTRQVLDRLSLRITPGECFGLLGPNGSGKSTALAIIAGLLRPTEGTITFAGQRLPGAQRLLRRSSGVVFQRPALDLKLSVAQNLALAARLQGLRGAPARQRIAEALELAGLSDRERDLAGVLSGGLKRRLDIARALLHEPRLLLLDEPTAGLDEVSFRQTWRQLDLLRQQRGLTIVLATHRPEEAERCDRLAIMAAGRVALIDTPEALKRRTQHDAVVIAPTDLAALPALCEDAAARFGLSCWIEGEQLVIEHARGHELIPRLVEAYPDGHLATVSLRHPTLADVFFKVTGTTLLPLDEQPAPRGAKE